MGIEERLITAITTGKSIEREDLVIEALLYCEGLGDKQIRLYKQRFTEIYNNFQRYKAEHLVSLGYPFLDALQMGNILARYLHSSIHGRKTKNSASLSKAIAAVLDKERYKREGVSCFGLQALYYCLVLKEGIKTEMRCDIAASKYNSKKDTLRTLYQFHLQIDNTSIPVSLSSSPHIGHKVTLDVNQRETVSTEYYESFLGFLKLVSTDKHNTSALQKKKRSDQLDLVIEIFRDIHVDLPSREELHRQDDEKKRDEAVQRYFSKFNAYLNSAIFFADYINNFEFAMALFNESKDIKRESYYLFNNVYCTRKELFQNYYKHLAIVFASKDRKDLAQEVLLEYYNFHKEDSDLIVYYKDGHMMEELFYEPLIETAVAIDEELGRYFEKTYAKRMIDHNIGYLGSTTHCGVTTYGMRGLQHIMDYLKEHSLVDDAEVLSHIKQYYEQFRKESKEGKIAIGWVQEIIRFFFQGEEQQKRIESLKD